jgi:phenylpropionate dioxygenase-like ring-hydroxylating dioxygenase large terminal subunit
MSTTTSSTPPIPVKSDTVKKEPTPPIWLAQDNRRASDAYLEKSFVDLGSDGVAVDRYIDPAFHAKEMKSLWPHVWQMACHEHEIPAVGDSMVYDIGDLSFVIVRSAENTIKAFRNACLHRGMQLRSQDGHVDRLKCPFHGWTWNLDGSLQRVPEQWDFPGLDKSKECLPEARVGTWGGFVFINMDPDAPSLEEYLGVLPAHFASAPLEHRFVAVHVGKIIDANWKVAMEAFMESYHVSPTHPQSVSIAEYAETQYDTYPHSPNISRLLTISVAASVPSTKALSEQELANHVAKLTDREPVQVPPGSTYRQALAQQRREENSKAMGRDLSHLTDVEMLDAVEYFVFPNFLPWHGFGLPIVYRFRPNGNRHDQCLMEVYVMAPLREGATPPKPGPMVMIEDGRTFSETPQLGRLGPIFDQDYANIVGVQKGLKATARDKIRLAHYQESRIRHYHARIDEFLAIDRGEEKGKPAACPEH